MNKNLKQSKTFVLNPNDLKVSLTYWFILPFIKKIKHLTNIQKFRCVSMPTNAHEQDMRNFSLIGHKLEISESQKLNLKFEEVFKNVLKK